MVTVSRGGFGFSVVADHAGTGMPDRRLKIPRFHLRAHAIRAGAAFISPPEIKQ